MDILAVIRNVFVFFILTVEMYIHIYIYMCVCVCVCTLFLQEYHHQQSNERTITKVEYEGNLS